MRNATLGVVLIAVAMWASEASSKEEESSVDKIIEHAPKFCIEFCEKDVDCAWNREGTAADNAKQYRLGQCIFGCAMKIQRGAGVSVLYTNEEYEEIKKGDAVISGDSLADYYECLWDTFEFVCETGYGMEFSEYDADTKSQCSEYDACAALLGIDELPRYAWEEDEEFCEPDDYDAEEWTRDDIWTWYNTTE